MRPALPDLLKADCAVAVADLIAQEGVCELIEDIEVGRLAVDGESGVARTATGGHGQRLRLGEGQVVVVGEIDADNVGPKVGHDDEAARGIDGGLVRVRRLLAVGNLAGPVQFEDFLGQELDVCWVGDVPGGEAGAGAERKCDGSVSGLFPHSQ